MCLKPQGCRWGRRVLAGRLAWSMGSGSRANEKFHFKPCTIGGKSPRPAPEVVLHPPLRTINTHDTHIQEHTHLPKSGALKFLSTGRAGVDTETATPARSHKHGSKKMVSAHCYHLKCQAGHQVGQTQVEEDLTVELTPQPWQFREAPWTRVRMDSGGQFTLSCMLGKHIV